MIRVLAIPENPAFNRRYAAGVFSLGHPALKGWATDQPPLRGEAQAR
ncbi:MAG: hypothetical protein R3F11_21810 [Verrucomicrobiales bacterium]